MVGYSADGPARDRVMQMIHEKDRIESEIRDQTAILEAENNVGMHGPLVDDQGFPRSDIDVYKVRHARHRIICLQNDHKALMKRIEQGLAEVHSQFRPEAAPNGHASSSTNGHGHVNGHANGSSSGDNISNLGESHQAFAKIAFVHSGSPADMAGLSAEDEVLIFGSINRSNFRDITQVHDIVAHSVGQAIRVLVRRDNTVHSFSVTPRPWAQPGLLGCQIVRLP